MPVVLLVSPPPQMVQPAAVEAKTSLRSWAYVHAEKVTGAAFGSADTSVAVIQGRGGHAWHERARQKFIHNGPAGCDGFGVRAELAVRDRARFHLGSGSYRR